jgi:hypothetical protein
MFILVLSRPFSLMSALFAVLDRIFNTNDRGKTMLTYFCQLFA